jgi:cytochrome c peroxidase
MADVPRSSAADVRSAAAPRVRVRGGIDGNSGRGGSARPLAVAGALLLGMLVLGACAAWLGRSGVPRRDWQRNPLASLQLALGHNPQPVRLLVPARAPLSAVAQIGQRLFDDPGLSGSGRQSCASCHDAAHAHAPANDLPVQPGGHQLDRLGVRSVPSLDYLYRQPAFSIGPDDAEHENVDLQRLARLSLTQTRAIKEATTASTSARNPVPQGGLFWDGRADTLQQQASGPLFNPLEMDGGSVDEVARKIERAGYGPALRQLFGAAIFANPAQVVAEAMFAIARYQFENANFHAFSSKYDAWLQGRATLTRRELRGYLAFNDARRGNCAACHLDRPTRDGLPPLFTDAQYEALGVPRNPHLASNLDPAYFDLGLCGPYRTDLRAQTQYCGMFLTPTLRNVATRHAFFHNGVYRSLGQVLDFYSLRDVEPGRIYPTGADGQVLKFDDLPARHRANVDTSDPPFDRKAGDPPPMSERDRRDIVAFLATLTDGYAP